MFIDLIEKKLARTEKVTGILKPIVDVSNKTKQRGIKLLIIGYEHILLDCYVILLSRFVLSHCWA